MAYTLIGKIIDTDNNPIEFGSIYTSDSKGNPTSRVKSTTADDKGRWKLEGINDTDFITGQFVGFDKKTVSAKSNVKIPIPFSNAFSRNLIIKLPLSKSGSLSEVEVTVIEPKIATKKPMALGKYVAIGAGVLVLIGVIALISKKI
jgi:hypothetical protein